MLVYKTKKNVVFLANTIKNVNEKTNEEHVTDLSNVNSFDVVSMINALKTARTVYFDRVHVTLTQAATNTVSELMNAVMLDSTIVFFKYTSIAVTDKKGAIEFYDVKTPEKKFDELNAKISRDEIENIVLFERI